MFTNTIASAAAAAALMTAVPASAQSLLGIVGDAVGRSLQSRSMRKTCEQTAIRAQFLIELFDIERNRDMPNLGLDLRDAAAVQLAETSSLSLTYKGWRGAEIRGECHFDIALTLPAQQLGGPPGRTFTGPLVAVIAQRDGAWVFDHLIPDVERALNFHGELSSQLSAAITARQAQLEQVRIAQAQLREEQAAREQAEWAKAHPKEYAEQQRQRAKAVQQLLELSARADEAKQRRVAACVAAGGTWGYRTRRGVSVGQPGCFLQR